LKKTSFFKYFFYIFIFGIIGTIVTFLVVAPLTYITNSWNFYSLTFAQEPINFSIKEILLFSSIIIATDTVSALTFVKEESNPKLFSILFGEGVLNDAVCIVIYRIIKTFNFQDEEFTHYTLYSMLGSFILLFVISTIIGIFGGLSCSLFLKKLKIFKLNRTQENSIVIFFAFMTYSCTELLGYSPIISLLFCGIFMSQYAYYNLSFQAREESSIVSKIMSNIAEGFVFTYLGLTSVSITIHSISISFIFFMLIFVLLGRLISIYGISGILQLIRCPDFELKYSDKGIMSFAGSIRGAIAFGLAISIEAKSAENR
jgi:NhaP-type Na+/H+ or K+/H+ antiporter